MSLKSKRTRLTELKLHGLSEATRSAGRLAEKRNKSLNGTDVVAPHSLSAKQCF